MKTTKFAQCTTALSTTHKLTPQFSHRQGLQLQTTYNPRKPGGSAPLTSAPNPPFQQAASSHTYTPDHAPYVNSGGDSVSTADNLQTSGLEQKRYINYPTMNSSSTLLNRRPNAREQVLPLKNTNNLANGEETQTSIKEQQSGASSSAAITSHGRFNSVPATTQTRRSSDYLLNNYVDRRNSASRMPLQSPCFFHQRFENALNISQILGEIEADDWISHSRLVATATSVREVSRQLQRRHLKMEVKSVLIVTKARDNRLVYLTRELAEWLMSTPRYNSGHGNGLGVTVYVDAKLQKSKRFDAPGLIAKNPAFADMLKFWTIDMCWSCPDKFDLVLTLGGDGTVLFTLGFLTHFEFPRYKEHLNRVMGDTGMRVNLRMRFTCTVFRVDRRTGHEWADEQFEVVNELVIDRGPSPWVSNLELYGDEELLTVVQADGCIFSTPTGITLEQHPLLLCQTPHHHAK
ncbi:NAD(+) kinase [Ascosphaera pollenicola]|nr:NAD(+) kinase [Ascosphaera pollenicola]